MEETRSDRFMKVFAWTGLTSNGLSNKLGMNSRTIYNYTNKGVNPTDTCIRQLCKVFPQINPEWLFDGEGTMFVDGTNFEPVAKDVMSPEPIRTTDKFAKVTELYERLIASLESKCECLEKQLERANEMIDILKNK